MYCDDIAEETSADCNGNSIPEECDIAGGASPDCNGNGVPDACDIDSGFSEDVDMNGVPDECVAAQKDGDWSADIWGLEGETPYPDNQQGVPDQAVTLDGVFVFLDVDAEVPALRLINAATLDVMQDGDAGDFTIQGPANIDYNSTQPMIVGGDFDNRSTAAEIFDWSAGGMLLIGPLHSIEAAGENRGRWPAGFADNFAIGTLTLAAETTVQVIDTFDNQQDGAAECDEALYVDTRVLEAGATLLTNGCHVYYRELFNEGSIPGLGVDVLELLEPVPADFNGDGVVDAFDLAFLLGHWDDCPEPCTPGEPAETCVTDLNGDCVTEAFDLAFLLGSWGPP